MTSETLRRSLLLAPAILAVGLAAGFSISESGPSWFWSDTPSIGIALLAFGSLLGGAYFAARGRQVARR